MTSNPPSAPPNVQSQQQQSKHQQTEAQARRRDVKIDSTSSEATAAFIRRTLCPHNSSTAKDRTTPRPIEDLLPPLTSSNEIDQQLYALIAIIIRDHVYSWYGKITPDHDFVDEAIRIIAHCTRELEQRLRKIDLEALFLDEIPGLVDAHITAYRTSHRPLHPPPLAPDPRHAYHTLHPHPALSPVPDDLASPGTVKQQEENESAYRQLLVQGMLALLLPTEDLENGCLRTLLGDILGEMILGNWIGQSACEGRVWWEGIAKLAQTIREWMIREQPTRSPSLPALSPPSIADFTTAWMSQQLSTLLWQLIYYAFLILTVLRSTLIALFTSSSLPKRSSSSSRTKPKSLPKRPILNMRIWSLTSNLLDLPTRMPWLEGLLQLFRHGFITGPGRMGDTDGVLDRILAQHISHPLTRPTSYLPSMLQTLRTVLFPHNRRPLSSSLPAPIRATAETSRTHCAMSILSLISPMMRKMYLAQDEEEQRKLVEKGLDVFGDAYLNKHLVFAVLECLIVRIMPELGVESVEGLVRGRIGGGGDDDDDGEGEEAVVDVVSI